MTARRKKAKAIILEGRRAGKSDAAIYMTVMHSEAKATVELDQRWLRNIEAAIASAEQDPTDPASRKIVRTLRGIRRVLLENIKAWEKWERSLKAGRPGCGRQVLK
jgi:hypothetical protein